MDHENKSTDDGHTLHLAPLESRREYVKFAGVILGIVLLSYLVTTWRHWSVRQFMEDFMAVFFIVFASFKFVNIEMFAKTYQTYDLLTKKFPFWGYLFPFVEAGLGFAYLLTTKNTILNIITMLITGLAGYSVWLEIRKNANKRRKGHFMCACLGTFIRLPLSKVSFVEDALMFAMAGAMLVLL